MKPCTYKLTVAYDGTQYSGWQIQPKRPTIQEILEKTLGSLIKTPIKVIGSGRTDAGVHALAQVAHFSASQDLNLNSLLRDCNERLPIDIRLRRVEKVSHNFHARFCAKKKTYRYHLHLNPILDPFKNGYCLHVKSPLDLPLLKKGCSLFEGTHDFTSFANEANRGSAANSPIKTLYSVSLILLKKDLIIEFVGNGFLYKMVRNMVGTLLDIASHKIPLNSIEKLFECKDRRLASRAAPPQGLFLFNVDFAN